MVSTTLRDTTFDPFTSTLLNSVRDGVVVYDPQFRYQLFNRYMEELSGMRAQEVIGRCAFELFPHLKLHGVDKLLARAMAGETIVTPDTPYHVPGSGRSGWVVSQYSPIVDVTGERIGVIGIIREVSERKRVEDALRESERWFRSIIENASELVCVLDVDGTTRYVSPASRRVLGLAPEELVGRSVFGLVHPEDVRVVQLEFARVLERVGAQIPVEFRCRYQDGTWRSVVATARNLVHEHSVSGIVVNARDVTEQRVLERQFQHGQKMEAIGRLAGGIAHDFNNLLAVIQANAQLAIRGMEKGDAGYSEIEEIGQAADRAAVLTRQLLTFSRQQPLSMQHLRPNAVIEGVQGLLERLLGEGMKLTLSLEPLVGSVRADRGQLEQVLMNLVVNARDAMPNGGKVEIATGDVHVRPEVARYHPGVGAGAYVLISVSDTGVGMTQDVKARIFEPFFTTKDRARGTGLGLSMAYGIVQQCGGFTAADSEPGRGTCMKIYLPRVG